MATPMHSHNPNMLNTIAFYSHTWELGGVLSVTLNLAKFFHEQGVNVFLYCEKVNGTPFTPSQAETFTLRKFPENTSHDNGDSSCMWRKWIVEDGVDVIISQGFADLPYKVIKEETQAKTIYCLHGIPFFEEYLYISKRELALRGASLAEKLHWKWISKPAFRLSSHLHHNSSRNLAAALPYLDRVVCLTPAYAAELYNELKRVGKANKSDRMKFMSIVNPVPGNPLDVDITRKEKLVIYCGRLIKEDKRVERLLQVWARVEGYFPDWHLALIGSGIDEEELRKEAASLGLKGVTFEGFHHDVTPFYQKASINCLTSQYEGLPMTFIEGQQYGVVPIWFNLGSMPFIVQDGAGVKVRPYSISSYARKLSRIMRNPQELRFRAQRSISLSQRYKIENVGEQWLDLFRNIM